MKLNKYKLGQLIELLNNKNIDNQYKSDKVRGVNNKKELIYTKADIANRDLSKFSIVYPGEFFFNHRTSRHGDKFCITYNYEDEPIIVTEDYTCFKVKEEAKQLLSRDWLFIYFSRNEQDRYVMFNSWGSSTEFFNWIDICNIEIELPSIDIQEKYVAIYKAILENQKNYEKGLEDLKIVCDSMLDVIKNDEGLLHKLGDYIEKHEIKNISDEFGIESVKGITNKKEFDKTKADVENKSLNNFLIIDKNEFAYNSRTDGRDMLVLALNRSDDIYLVTSNYNSFRIKPKRKKELLEEYLYTLFKRKEFDRRVRFNSWGSSQEQLSWNDLCDFKVPIPSIEKQKAIASINDNYIQRKKINDRLKEQIKKICPILIKGSLEEAKSN